VQAGLTDNVGEAYYAARDTIDRTATAQGWTDDQRAAALADVDDAYDAVTGWEGLALGASSLLSDYTAGENQVIAFYDELRARAASWTGANAAKLAATFGAAATTATTTAEQTIGSPVEAVGDLVVDPLAMTAQQVSDTATDPRVWIAVAAVAVVVLVIAVRR